LTATGAAGTEGAIYELIEIVSTDTSRPGKYAPCFRQLSSANLPRRDVNLSCGKVLSCSAVDEQRMRCPRDIHWREAAAAACPFIDVRFLNFFFHEKFIDFSIVLLKIVFAIAPFGSR
jgi:hypothetical protein